MSVQCDGIKTFIASEAIGAWELVKLNASDSTKVDLADADEVAIGVAQEAAASGAPVPVRLLTSGKTFKMKAGAAITKLKTVFGIANGKIDDVAGAGNVGPQVGIALEAASGDGSIIEVLALAPGARAVAGQHTTVAASDAVVTGLSEVFAVVAQLDSDPIDAAQHVTASIGDQAGTPAAGSILVKTWKMTATNDATLIPATTFSRKVNWIAYGR